MRYFTLDTQVKLYRGTVIAIMKAENGAIPTGVERSVSSQLKTLPTYVLI